ncbi:metallophosphoesterase [Erysipelotrichaceae bacterium]|nr:metallophosphoesterase [Erysipelotrichaceae bacterium]
MFLKHRKLLIFLSLAIFLLSTLFYGYAIEKKRVVLSRQTLAIHNLPSSWKNVKIGFFGDTSFGSDMSTETFSHAVKKLRDEQPDIVFFSGNLLSPHNNKLTIDASIVHELSSIEAPLGKFAILGEDDLLSGIDVRVRAILQQSDFELLQSGSRPLYNQTQQPFELLAIGADVQGQKALDILATDSAIPKILLTSNNKYLLSIATNPHIVLSLAGGTYGGLIGLPFVDGLLTPSESKKHIKGPYMDNEQLIFVSRGIGTPDNFPLRLFNYPTVYLLRLQEKR